ncbi:hypothetical protein PG994_010283 [Apiospora phragmitis]|uniref:Uncharacterized protein n=1 Tax=Apiospora phragmitis TaxID=2905665 RepID=A0ABR1TPH1_9PEZI
MQLNSLLFAGMLALTANAADSSLMSTMTSMDVKETKSTSSAPTTTVGLTPEQSAKTACLDACKTGDVNCEAKCVGVPNPNTQQVNATNNCIAACPLSKGTAAENKEHDKCVNDCIGQYYLTSAGASATSTNSAQPSSSVVDVVSTVTSGDSTFTTTMHSTKLAAATNTDTGDSATSTGDHKNAAQAMNRLAPIGSGIGLLGFLAAFFAL